MNPYQWLTQLKPKTQNQVIEELLEKNPKEIDALEGVWSKQSQLSDVERAQGHWSFIRGLIRNLNSKEEGWEKALAQHAQSWAKWMEGNAHQVEDKVMQEWAVDVETWILVQLKQGTRENVEDNWKHSGIGILIKGHLRALSLLKIKRYGRKEKLEELGKELQRTIEILKLKDGANKQNNEVLKIWVESLEPGDFQWILRVNEVDGIAQESLLSETLIKTLSTLDGNLWMQWNKNPDRMLAMKNLRDESHITEKLEKNKKIIDFGEFKRELNAIRKSHQMCDWDFGFNQRRIGAPWSWEFRWKVLKSLMMEWQEEGVPRPQWLNQELFKILKSSDSESEASKIQKKLKLEILIEWTKQFNEHPLNEEVIKRWAWFECPLRHTEEEYGDRFKLVSDCIKSNHEIDWEKALQNVMLRWLRVNESLGDDRIKKEDFGAWSQKTWDGFLKRIPWSEVSAFDPQYDPCWGLTQEQDQSEFWRQWGMNNPNVTIKNGATGMEMLNEWVKNWTQKDRESSVLDLGGDSSNLDVLLWKKTMKSMKSRFSIQGKISEGWDRVWRVIWAHERNTMVEGERLDESKDRWEGFWIKVLGTLGSSSNCNEVLKVLSQDQIQSMLKLKGVYEEGERVMRAGNWFIRAMLDRPEIAQQVMEYHPKACEQVLEEWQKNLNRRKDKPMMTLARCEEGILRCQMMKRRELEWGTSEQKKQEQKKKRL